MLSERWPSKCYFYRNDRLQNHQSAEPSNVEGPFVEDIQPNNPYLQPFWNHSSFQPSFEMTSLHYDHNNVQHVENHHVGKFGLMQHQENHVDELQSEKNEVVNHVDKTAMMQHEHVGNQEDNHVRLNQHYIFSQESLIRTDETGNHFVSRENEIIGHVAENHVAISQENLLSKTHFETSQNNNAFTNCNNQTISPNP